MKIVVCVKQVIDPDSVKYNIETGRIENVYKYKTGGAEKIYYIINPLDEMAICEALHIREGAGGGKVTAISLGPPRVEGALQRCLCMGVDEAIHLYGFEDLDAYATSIVLARFIAELQYDLILCGKESADEGNSFVGAGIAEWLGLPLVTAVTKIDILDERAIVQRRVGGGNREVIHSRLPAVFTVDASLGRVRSIPLKTVLAGLKKKIVKSDIASLGLVAEDIKPVIDFLGISQPKPRLKKATVPDSHLPASERIKALLSGGISQKGTKMIEKPSEVAAAEMVCFLLDNGIVPKSGGEFT